LIRLVPQVKNKIETELAEAKVKLEKDLVVSVPGEKFHLTLPEEGLSAKEIEAELEIIHKMGTSDYNNGRVSGCLYHEGEERNKEYHTLLTNTFGKFMWTNPLHIDIFPGVRKMEAEIVRIVCGLFRGDSETCGFVSSGGTESILMAVKGYRSRAYERGITKPELIVPVTAHVAFDKACDYFGIKIIHIPVDEKTRRVDVKKVRSAISRNTIALVGSAPSFPHGVIDPIEELAALARAYDIGMHVDSCLGGFLTIFMRDAGFDVPPCDFSVPGVTSISADTHKYGFAPKGSSVLMWRNKKWRSYQYFTTSDWPGGLYFSPAMAGSRSGGIIATTWVALMYHGKKSYVESTRRIVETTRWIQEEIRKTPHLFVYGTADTSVVGFGSNDFNILRLSSYLSKKGWNLSNLQFPSSIHICVTLVHTKGDSARELIQDIRQGVEEIMKNPNEKAEGVAALYGTAQQIPDRSIIHDVGKLILDVSFTAVDGDKKI